MLTKVLFFAQGTKESAFEKGGKRPGALLEWI